MKIKNPRYIKNRIVATIIVAFLLCVTFLSMIDYAYSAAEESAFESLHMRTKEIKDDISLQFFSDRENLTTIANMAANLYKNGDSYDMLFDSFKSIGLIENICILTPDGLFRTKMGEVNVENELVFSEEAKNAPHITGIVSDLTNSKMKVVRSSVPIKVAGETVGILYGVIRLASLEKHYKPMADSLDARLYIIDRTTGDFIVDTWRDDTGNLFEARVIQSKKGYSYDEMRDDIKNGKNGFCAYRSNISHVMMYSHYSPIDIEDWHIVLSVPESVVFAQAEKMHNGFMVVFLVVILIMVFYVIMIFGSERKLSKTTVYASGIRKLLLSINQEKAGIAEALQRICEFSEGVSSFFIDLDGEDYNYIIPSSKDKLLEGDDRRYIASEIFEIASRYHKESNVTLLVFDLSADSKLSKSNPNLYAFLKEKEIKHIAFAAVSDKNEHISVLGVVNPDNKSEAKELLREIAVCFSISIYNKKHLDKTESDAVTDALTGLSNRVAYKRDIIGFDNTHPQNFACMYIDVNELHSYNNKYGHAAGDEMLIYVANCIKEVFFGHHLYRMGGDEYLIFTEGLSKEAVEKHMSVLLEKIEKKGYHISIGMNYSIKNINTESLVREAEKRMYDAKARYYQEKEKQSFARTDERRFKFIETGIKDLDMMIKVLSGHYSGIYSVSLETDIARRIIMPSYLDFKETEEKFSEIMKDYIHHRVHPDFHRGMLRFLNYDVLKEQIENGQTPRFTYKKENGEGVILTVYAQGDETLWVFENA
ncbi:MAG: GGDEF domain-containing protein [Clostridia bacterium]|nr:GGDEF domain-containing protein [Clostridia bacterium]